MTFASIFATPMSLHAKKSSTPVLPKLRKSRRKKHQHKRSPSVATLDQHPQQQPSIFMFQELKRSMSLCSATSDSSSETDDEYEVDVPMPVTMPPPVLKATRLLPRWNGTCSSDRADNVDMVQPPPRPSIGHDQDSVCHSSGYSPPLRVMPLLSYRPSKFPLFDCDYANELYIGNDENEPQWFPTMSVPLPDLDGDLGVTNMEQQPYDDDMNECIMSDDDGCTVATPKPMLPYQSAGAAAADALPALSYYRHVASRVQLVSFDEADISELSLPDTL